MICEVGCGEGLRLTKLVSLKAPTTDCYIPMSLSGDISVQCRHQQRVCQDSVKWSQDEQREAQHDLIEERGKGREASVVENAACSGQWDLLTVQLLTWLWEHVVAAIVVIAVICTVSP